MKTKKRTFIGYALLTNGPRHTNTPWKERPEAKPQIQTVENFSEKMDNVEIRWIADYARKVRGLRDLPALKNFLEVFGSQKGNVIIMDDVSRIFKICSETDALTILNSLSQSKVKFHDCRTRSLVSEFSDFKTGHAIYAANKLSRKPSILSPMEREMQTMKAQHASQRIRSGKAYNAAKPLFDLKVQLEKDGIEVSYNELACQANALGLKTTRGGEWSGKSAQRAVARCSEPVSD